MKKILIVHGLMASPTSGWFPWLITELGKKGINTRALPMPNTNNPNKKKWVNEIKKATEGEKTEDIILVGHSLGVPTVLRFLEENEDSFLGVVLVSGAVKQITKANFVIQAILKRFIGEDFNWKKIKSRVKHVVVIHGKDDKKVPFEHAEIISRNLGVQPILLEAGSHLSGRENSLELPEALEAILGIIHPTLKGTPQEGN